MRIDPVKNNPSSLPLPAAVGRSSGESDSRGFLDIFARKPAVKPELGDPTQRVIAQLQACHEHRMVTSISNLLGNVNAADRELGAAEKRLDSIKEVVMKVQKLVTSSMNLLNPDRETPKTAE